MGSTARIGGGIAVIFMLPLFAHAQVVVLPPPIVVPGPSITNISLVSSNASTTLAKPGDTITLSFTSNGPSLVTPDATLDSEPAVVSNTGGDSWAAAVTLNAGDIEGLISYSADIGDSVGGATSTISATTDVVFDATAPVITLLGDPSITLTVGDAFTDPGFTSDGGDNDATSTSGTVDVNTAGTYTLTYNATDAAGNTASTTRTVIVNAPPAPEPSAPVSSSGGNGPIAGSYGAVSYTPPPPPPPAPVVAPAPAPAPAVEPAAAPVHTPVVETPQPPAPVEPETPVPVQPTVAAPVAPVAQTAAVATVTTGLPFVGSSWWIILLLIMVLIAVSVYVTKRGKRDTTRSR